MHLTEIWRMAFGGLMLSLTLVFSASEPLPTTNCRLLGTSLQKAIMPDVRKPAHSASQLCELSSSSSGRVLRRERKDSDSSLRRQVWGVCLDLRLISRLQNST